MHGPPELETTLDALLAFERPGSNGGLGFNLGLAEQWLSQQQQQQQQQQQLEGQQGQGLAPGKSLLGTSPTSTHHQQQAALGSSTQSAYSSAQGAAAAACSTTAAGRSFSSGCAASPPGLQGSQGTFQAASAHPGPGAGSGAAAAANAASGRAAQALQRGPSAAHLDACASRRHRRRCRRCNQRPVSYARAAGYGFRHSISLYPVLAQCLR